MRLWVLVVGVALGARAGATPRPGKVVRVERTPRAKVGTPRLCLEVRDEGQGPLGTCYGPQPALGSLIDVVDDTRVFAQVRISDVARLAPNCPSIWSIRGVLQAGDLPAVQNGRAVGLVDAGIDPHAARRIADDQALPSPSGRTDERVQIAIDREGKGRPSLLVTQYSCDPQGQANAMGAGQCMDTWAATGDRVARVQQILFAGCY